MSLHNEALAEHQRIKGEARMCYLHTEHGIMVHCFFPGKRVCRCGQKKVAPNTKKDNKIKYFGDEKKRW